MNARWYKFFCVAWFVMGLGLTAFYAAKGDMYHMGISAGTLAVPMGIWVIHRIFRLKPSPRLNFVILIFAFIAYPLGACIDMYRMVPGFDKAAHMLSGSLAAVLCGALFIALKPGHRLGRVDVPMALVFAFFGSMAVAGMWEVGEYALSAVTGMDLQRVIATGISDSMNDMIVCLVGTLGALPVIPRLAQGKNGLLSGAVREFAELNFTGKAS